MRQSSLRVSPLIVIALALCTESLAFESRGITFESEGEGYKLHRIAEGVTSPRLLYKVSPTYSKKARKARRQGIVMLAVEIWEDGLAHNIRILRSLGLGLDEKAVEAVKKWKFSPGKKDGKPVRVAAQIQVSFRLLERPE